jgi:hypothetical protein
MDAIDYLKALATIEACRGGYEFKIERSDVSEATYVKVRRDETWYGIRIASHPHYYASSADYEQVLVSLQVENAAELADAEADLVRSIHDGGRIVADPQETAFALLEELRAKRGRTIVRGDQRTVWKWDEDALFWRLLRVDNRAATPADERRLAHFRPLNAPEVRLTSAEQSAVRHRLNLRAEWAHEEAQRFAVA